MEKYKFKWRTVENKDTCQLVDIGEIGFKVLSGLMCFLSSNANLGLQSHSNSIK